MAIRYVPDRLCVELKSLKLYLWRYRDEAGFNESLVDRMLTLCALEHRETIERREIVDMNMVLADVLRRSDQEILTLLRQTDLVKFADIVPSEAEAYELIAQGRMIVESTKPLTISPDDLNGSSGLNGGSPDAVVAARAFSSNGQNDTIEVSA